MLDQSAALATATPRRRNRAPDPTIRLQRFAPRHRAQVMQLAARDRKVADLAVSFPALLFALAVPRRGQQTEHILAHLLDGAKLKVLAQLAGVPMWLRALPPEAFATPLGPLPNSAEFQRRIANHLPRAPTRAFEWLNSVACAARWGHEDFAIWAARQPPPPPPPASHPSPTLLCLWAWHSTDSRAPAIVRPSTIWNPEMESASARTAALAWRSAMNDYFILPHGRADEMWLAPGQVDGFEFVPVATRRELREEGDAMKHCVGTYATSVARNTVRIWSIRQNGVRVATLSIQRPRPLRPLVEIQAIRGQSNEPASPEIWLAASRWLISQDLMQASANISPRRDLDLDRPLWRRAWKPYWMDKSSIPAWLPLTPSAFDFLNL